MLLRAPVVPSPILKRKGGREKKEGKSVRNAIKSANVKEIFQKKKNFDMRQT